MLHVNMCSWQTTTLMNKPVLSFQCITAASMFCFIIGNAQELFVVILIQETCIALFFIIIYLVTLQNTLACIHWPLLVSYSFL